ncbi:MAG: phosphoribosylamine--glycine ligase [Actinobacteria bacterium]|nr:MAG: phosphoribosylamine--glycine ligase [Actinomycetota bacterium]
MRLLVIGGGGREHAIVWKASRNPTVEKIFCSPGNGGISLLAECVDLDPNDETALVDFVASNDIDLTVIGPEAPLVAGAADTLRLAGRPVFGPVAAAAQIEGSKSFAKEIMEAAGVPTGKARSFELCEEAREYISRIGVPVVVKADGLAAGKGVIIAKTFDEAKHAVEDCMLSREFGEAGDKVLVEEFLEGQEVSLLAFADGRKVLPMVPAQDYKRVGDDDEGPNTGGMGCYSPVPIVPEDMIPSLVERIHAPVIHELADRGIDFAGVLYAGLIFTGDGPKVLEFNARFGDPETQVILPRMETDLVEVMEAVAAGRLDDWELAWRPEVCVTVVLASGGYPGSYETGKEITGLEAAGKVEGVTVFHAGTKREDGKFYTSGGRVLNVTALGEDFRQARERAYEAVSRIHFDGMHYRKDIAKRVEEQGDVP